MVGSTVVVGVLICCALLLSASDLIAAQMNIQGSLIQELMLYTFESSYNTRKGENTVNHRAEIQWFIKFLSGYKTLMIRQGNVGLKP